VVGYDDAPNGIVGLETAFPICHAKVVETGTISPLDLVRPLTIGPAGILGLDRGHLTVGGVADLTIIDMRKKYRIHAEKFQSKSRNTPFEGWMVRGRIVETLVEGRTVYKVDKERSSDD
jgi:dihydroorotase